MKESRSALSTPSAPAQNAAPLNARVQAQEEFEQMFAQWKQTGDPKLRDRLILRHRNLVLYLSRRFAERGELLEDVVGIGMVGLINALDSFDPARGVKFSTFATPTIAGEIRRHFRDKVAGMRVPRRIQELNSTIHARIEELTQQLNRSPTYPEIAYAMGIEVEEVVELMELGQVLDPMSLDDAIFGGDESAAHLSDTLGALDPDIASFEDNQALELALARLTKEQRHVLELAYFEGRSQAEIARLQKVSQMHVSRLMRKALAQLRILLEE